VKLQSVLDEHTGPWGVKVSNVAVKQVDLPDQMIRAIARQAEAERERRAKIIHAEGEAEAAANLEKAAEMMARQPAAIQLRYLQTLVEIGSEKNTTVVFPLPMDILSNVGRILERWRTPAGRQVIGGRRCLETKMANSNWFWRSPAIERVLHRVILLGGILHDGLHRAATLRQRGSLLGAKSDTAPLVVDGPAGGTERLRRPASAPPPRFATARNNQEAAGRGAGR
jgi:hypothetical protein